MKILTLYLLILLMPIGLNAKEKDTVTKEELIASFILYREAVDNLNTIHSEIIPLDKNSYNEDDMQPKLSRDQKQSYLDVRRALLESAELNPYNPEVFMYLGISYLEIEEDKKEAYKYFTSALELDPKYEAILAFRCSVSIELKLYNEAKKDLLILKEIGSDSYAIYLEELNEKSP